MTPRRDRGDGCLIVRQSTDHRGGETWIGKWRAEREPGVFVQVQRTIGRKRCKRWPDGLTKPMAEAAFRKMREEHRPKAQAGARRTLAQVGAAMIRDRQAKGRKSATIESYDSLLRLHVVPFFGVEDLAGINRER